MSSAASEYTNADKPAPRVQPEEDIQLSQSVTSKA